MRFRACVLEIVSAAGNKIVFTVKDRLTCAQEYDHEDGYTIAHAHQFAGFLRRNFNIIAPLLSQFEIDYSRFPAAQESPDQDNSRRCAKLAGLRLCKSENQRVLVEKIR